MGKLIILSRYKQARHAKPHIVWPTYRVIDIKTRKITNTLDKGKEKPA